MSKKRTAPGVRRPSGAEEGEAACRGRRGGGSASPTIKEAQGLSNSCSGLSPATARKGDGPLEELTREARQRLAEAEEVSCAFTGSAYEVRAARGGSTARGKLKARFWHDYLASGRTDGCDCVDHFFDRLKRELEGVE